MAITCGIDPGGAATGLVLRERDQLLDHAVIERAKRDDSTYFNELIETSIEFARRAHLIAIEGVVAPSTHINGKKRFVDPQHVQAGAVTYGVILGVLMCGEFPIVTVRPNGHGSRHEALGLDVRRLYPAALVGPREGPAGTGRLRHVRSAWDVAGAAAPIRPGRA